jgi:alpha-beta hydrolase superfamily lysophospholipase
LVQEAGPAVRAPTLSGAGDRVYVAADGLRLPMRVWPAEGEPKAVLLALHGFNDYSNAFADPAVWWAARGVTTYAYDQRGFGAARQAGLWPGVAAMVTDLRAVAALVRARHPRAPLYVLGVSMGGAVVLAALGQPAGPGDPLAAIDGAVLVAPAVWGRATMNPLYRTTLWLGAHTMPWLRVTGRGLDILPSDNIEMLRALGRDPLVIKETRIDALYGLVNLMDTALAASAQVEIPLLILFGALDEVIPKVPTRRMIGGLSGPRRFALYDAGYHMLLRDLQAEPVWRDVLAWAQDPTAPLPSGAEADGGDVFLKGGPER